MTRADTVYTAPARQPTAAAVAARHGKEKSEKETDVKTSFDDQLIYRGIVDQSIVHINHMDKKN